MSTTDIGGIVASLRVLDEFTAPIAAALDQIAELEAAMDRFKAASGGISGPFSRLGSAIARAQKPLADLTAKLDGLDGPINVAADRLSVLQDRTAAIAAESAAAARNFASIGKIRVPAAAGGGGGNGRSGGGGVAGGAEEAGGGYLAGRLSKIGSRALSIPGLGIGFAVYDSMKQALSENLALAQTLMAFNVQGQSAAQRQSDLDRLHALIRQSAIGTIYTEQETAQAALGAAQMSGFTGRKGIEQFASVFPIALRMAEVGQMQGLGSIADNIKAAIGYAHLTQRYSAGQLAPGLDEILAIAERTNTSLTAVENTMKYALPIAVAAGANVDQATAATGFLMRAGLGRTAGYALGNMILGVLTAGGPVNAQLAQEREAVRKQLGSHAASVQNMNAHVAALRDLGIMNAANKLTVLNKQGGVDLEKILADIQKYGAAHTQADLADVLYRAFGIRGMRGASLLALQKELFSAFEKTLAGTPGAAAQQAAFAQTPLQQFEQVLARLQDIGNIMATTVLPDFTQLTGGLLVFLDALDHFLSRHQFLASLLGHIAVGAAAGAAVGAEPGAVVGATAGALKATVDNMQAPFKPPPGSPLARLLLPQQPADNHVTVTVNAPLTVEGSMFATREDIEMLLNDWWSGKAGAITATVEQSLAKIQHHKKRASFLDPAYAYVP